MKSPYLFRFPLGEVVCLNGNIFDEQCRLCKFLTNPPTCARRNIESAKGVDVCTGYEAVEV